MSCYLNSLCYLHLYLTPTTCYSTPRQSCTTSIPSTSIYTRLTLAVVPLYVLLLAARSKRSSRYQNLATARGSARHRAVHSARSYNVRDVQKAATGGATCTIHQYTLESETRGCPVLVRSAATQSHAFPCLCTCKIDSCFWVFHHAPLLASRPPTCSPVPRFGSYNGQRFCSRICMLLDLWATMP